MEWQLPIIQPLFFLPLWKIHGGQDNWKHTCIPKKENEMDIWGCCIPAFQPWLVIFSFSRGRHDVYHKHAKSTTFVSISCCNIPEHAGWLARLRVCSAFLLLVWGWTYYTQEKVDVIQTCLWRCTERGEKGTRGSRISEYYGDMLTLSKPG